MPDSNLSARIVLTTAASAEEAECLARTLVEESLAACATIIPSVRSIYRWEGKIEDASEIMLLIKTNTEQLAALETRLHALHSYDTPEFLVLPIATGSRQYLNWMMANLNTPEPEQSS